MSLCLALSLVYFLIPPSLACQKPIQPAKQKEEEIAYQEWRASLDFSFLDMPYSKCKIGKSAPALSGKEKCYVRRLSARCSEADDCLVQCIARGMNEKVGGGCWHICFDDKFNLSKWKPPRGWNACSKASGTKK